MTISVRRYVKTLTLDEAVGRTIKEYIEEGKTEGKIEGGIEILILDNLEEGTSPERICEKLVKRFNLTKEQSWNYLNQYIK